MSDKWKASLHINQKLEFVLSDLSKASSMVQDFDDENIMVTVPVQRGYERLLETSKNLEMLLYGSDRIFSLLVRIIEKRKMEIPLYVLCVVESLGEIQRRQHVRAGVDLPVSYVRFRKEYDSLVEKETAETLLKQLKSLRTEGMMVDLSAGGIMLSTLEKLDCTQELLLFFTLETGLVMAKGKICHLHFRDHHQPHHHHYGISFVGLKRQTEDAMMKFVFKRLRHSKAY
jgi:c-di-GMP-binding flagellar brake protein YcgR